MADEIRVDYDQLRQVAAHFSARANSTQQTHQSLQRSMNRLQGAWDGRGSQAFFTEMTAEILPALQRLTEALRRAQAVTLQASRIFQAAEEDAARPFGGPAIGPGLPAPDAGISPLRPIIDTLKDISVVADLAPIPAAILLAMGLSAGVTYPGQVLIRVPQLLRDLGISGRMLREVAGVSEYLTHIQAANIATHIGQVTKSMIAVDALIAAGKGVIAVADVWERNSAEYAGYDLGRGVSARAVDAGMALLPVGAGFAGSVGGVLVGAKVGMLVGTLGGPVGIVAGGIVGSAVGGLAGDWIGGTIGSGAVNLLQEHVSRDQMIDFVDEKIAQPVTHAVGAATETVGSWFQPFRQPEFTAGW